MKSRITLLIVTLVTIVFIVGCQKAPMVKRAIEQPKPEEKPKALVEVLDFKMEKMESWAGPDYGTIKITGTAVYTGTKKFDEEISGIEFGLYDEKGNQVRRFGVSNSDCGEYKNPKNIVSGKPFPFESEDPMIKKALWKVITEARFEKITKW